MPVLGATISMIITVGDIALRSKTHIKACSTLWPATSHLQLQVPPDDYAEYRKPPQTTILAQDDLRRLR